VFIYENYFPTYVITLTQTQSSYSPLATPKHPLESPLHIWCGALVRNAYRPLCIYLHCVPINRTRIVWPIIFINIDQYQCHLTELFVQHYLIIYHKNYSHSRVPAPSVDMATSALSQTKACVNSAHLPIVHVPPSSICQRPHLIWFLPMSSHLITRPKSSRLQNLGLSSRPCLAEAHSWHQRADTALGWCMVRLRAESHWRGHRWVEKTASSLHPYEKTPFRTCLVNLSFFS